MKKDILIKPIHVYIITLSFFLFTLVHNFSAAADGIDYLVEFENGQNLFQPHHLFYHYSTYILFSILRSIFFFIPNHYLVEGISSIWGAGVVTILYSIFKFRFKQSSYTSLLASLLPTFSFGIWVYSTNVEVYMQPLFFILLCIYFLTKDNIGRKEILQIILFHSLAILFHQVNILFTPVVLYGFWMHRKKVALTFSFLYYALAGGGLVILIYLVSWYFAPGVRGNIGFTQWLRGYTESSDYWFPASLSTAVNALVGFSRAFIGSNFVFKIDFINDYLGKTFFYHNLSDELFLVRKMSQEVAIFLLFLTGIAFAFIFNFIFSVIKRIRKFYFGRTFLLNVIILTFIIYATFFFFWMPQIVDFWITQMVLFWLFFTGGWLIVSKSSEIRKRIILGTLASFIFIINFFGSMKWLFSINNDLYYAKIEPVVNQGKQNDLILLEDNWLIGRYLERYSELPSNLIPDTSDMKYRIELDEKINTTFSQNGRVFLFTDKSVKHAVFNPNYVDSLLKHPNITIDTLKTVEKSILLLKRKATYPNNENIP